MFPADSSVLPLNIFRVSIKITRLSINLFVREILWYQCVQIEVAEIYFCGQRWIRTAISSNNIERNVFLSFDIKTFMAKIA